MEKAGIKDLDKMQEDIKKETPVPSKENVKILFNYLNFKSKSLY